MTHISAGLEYRLNEARRWLGYAFYDWSREMPRRRRVLTVAALWIQGGAVFALWTRSATGAYAPMIPFADAAFWLVYLLGYCMLNGMLTSEFLRKTQLEADQIAARQIQQTLQPQSVEQPPGYMLETLFQPFREVGGDYFDIIRLDKNRTLIAMADVSGKGMPAALLSSNIQAMVRSIASADIDLALMAARMNAHLCRYTPGDRYATALFVMLDNNSGLLSYVNAGHNAPMVASPNGAVDLEATGLPLGLFPRAEFEVRTTVLERGCHALFFTDGLSDSIPDGEPQRRLREVVRCGSRPAMSSVLSLMAPQSVEDDITVLLLTRL